jgi:hypothetical protein
VSVFVRDHREQQDRRDQGKLLQGFQRRAEVEGKRDEDSSSARKLVTRSTHVKVKWRLDIRNVRS